MNVTIGRPFLPKQNRSRKKVPAFVFADAFFVNPAKRGGFTIFRLWFYRLDGDADSIRIVGMTNVKLKSFMNKEKSPNGANVSDVSI